MRQLRRELGLTQEEFAKRIGIKRNSYANYEIGRNNPIDAVVYSICREFRVSEAWLRNGEGEMFVPYDDEEKLNQWTRAVFTEEGDSFRKRFAMMMTELTPEQWRELEALVQKLAGTDKGTSAPNREMQE